MCGHIFAIFSLHRNGNVVQPAHFIYWDLLRIWFYQTHTHAFLFSLKLQCLFFSFINLLPCITYSLLPTDPLNSLQCVSGRERERVSERVSERVRANERESERERAVATVTPCLVPICMHVYVHVSLFCVLFVHFCCIAVWYLLWA